VDVAILAGGQARRLGGRNKGALHVGRSSIIDRQLATLSGLADRIFVVAGDPEPYRDKRVAVIGDLLPGAGALGGIYTALSVATTDHVFVLACDLPFVSRPLVSRLVGLASPQFDVVVPRTPDGLQPLCAVYSRRLVEPVRRQIDSGHLKVVDLFATARVRELSPDELADIEPESRAFFNVNTPSDLDEAIRLATWADGPTER
jgi:molybdopterin-guanine dinucleotide biosynthesis protein A